MVILTDDDETNPLSTNYKFSVIIEEKIEIEVPDIVKQRWEKDEDEIEE